MVHVVTPVDAVHVSQPVQTVEEHGYVLHRYSYDLTDPKGVFGFRDFLIELDTKVGFDLFHGFFLTVAYGCVSIARLNNRTRPVIASIRGNDALTLIKHPQCRSGILMALKRVNWVTSVNQTYLDLVCEEVDVSGKCSVIRNGVIPPDDSVETWSLSDANRGVVGTIGELRRVKDIPLLIRGYAGATAPLRRNLRLAGFFNDVEEESWSKVLIAEFQIEDEVTVTGRFPNSAVYDQLRKMHIYVQSSAYEGLPNALLEAASIGLPLIATAVGGMKEVLRHEENALLVPHGDPRALSQAIDRVLENDELANQLSQGAKKLSRELSPESERVAWLDLYRRTIDESNGVAT